MGVRAELTSVCDARFLENSVLKVYFQLSGPVNCWQARRAGKLHISSVLTTCLVEGIGNLT